MATRGAAAWPRIRVTHAELVEFLRQKASSGSSFAKELRAEDLCLVLGCLRGDAEAWRIFDRTLLAKVPMFVARVSRSAAFADEVRQRLSEKLSLDGRGGRSKLEQYSGLGPLEAWLRMAALREAQTLVRRSKPEVDADDVPLRAAGLDPELLLLKRRSASLFKRVFAGVLSALPAEERMLLRLHYAEGLTLDAVAKVAGVSRATAARSLAQARERVVKRVERALRDDLGKEAPALESLLALVRSELDVSVARHLGERTDD